MNRTDVFSAEYLDKLDHVDRGLRPMHDPRDEYHGYDIHPRGETLPATRRIARACLAAGIPVDLVVTDCASLGHDAFTTEPLLGDDYATKEERAAEATALVMELANFDNRQLVHAADAIVTTNRYVPYYRIEDAVLGLGDMINVSGPYLPFLRRSEDARLETERTTHCLISLDDWLANTPAVLEDFCFKPLPGNLLDVPLVKALRQGARHNLDSFKRETPQTYLAKLALITRRVAS